MVKSNINYTVVIECENLEKAENFITDKITSILLEFQHRKIIKDFLLVGNCEDD